MSGTDHLLSDDDGERGERQPTDADDVETAAALTDRLQSHQTKTGDAQGLRSTTKTGDVGHQADVAGGESGDAG
jgi:hypothetical protein